MSSWVTLALPDRSAPTLRLAREMNSWPKGMTPAQSDQFRTVPIGLGLAK